MTPTQSKIANYLLRSAGTCNYPTDHTLRCFAGMLETGEATDHDFRLVGGDWLIREIQRVKEQ